MPRAKKTRNPQPPEPPVIDEYPDPSDLNLGFEEAVQAIEQPRTSRKKVRNAHTNASTIRVESSSPEPPKEESLASHDPHFSPVRQSLLSQISFHAHGKSRPVDIRDDLVSTEKVSDQYTPPSDAGIPEDAYSISPNTESVAVSSPANTPPVEPVFAARSPYKIRSPPISPPPRHARPLSFGSSIPPLPTHGHQSRALYGSPPAPHLPQPHFYGAHDIDLGIPKPRQSTSEEIPLFSKFVQLHTLTATGKTGVLLGLEGALRFCLYDGSVVEDIGALPSLPGSVIDADLLGWSFGLDPFSALRPLIAVNILQTEVSPEGVTRHIFCVSVYSLSQQKHVVDLLQIPATPAQHSNTPSFMLHSLEFRNHLRITSAGNYLCIASGRSGEVYVFCPVATGNGPTFECLNKFWTSLQPREPKRDSSHNRITSNDAVIARTRHVKLHEDIPMLAISGRWLAICPPRTSSQHTVGAVLGSEVIVGKQAGIETSSATNRPSIDCDVDSPDADTLLGKVARGVAQEMVKGAKWLGDQGLQVWQNYWKKEDAVNSAVPISSFPAGDYRNSQMYEQFPPTHADARPVTKDPEIISLFDLKSLSDPIVRRSGVPTPFATFLPPHGCSFLSFAPNGLVLLTASRKGDFQYIWDLLETKHNRTSFTDLEGDSTRLFPRVRQMARFDRMSGSVIVDVMWESPNLSRFALLTKNKTIHLFELPTTAMRWPPARTSNRNRPSSAPPTGPPASEQGVAPIGGFLASALSIAGRTQPMIANLRGRAPSSGAGLAGIGSAGFGIATATGARGSKAVASGLSKSLGAATETVSRLHHAGESRLHLKSEREAIPGRMIWMSRASKSGLVVIADNGIKFYHVRRTKARDQRHRETTVFDARRAVTVKIPSSDIPIHELSDFQGFGTRRKGHCNNTSTIHPLSFAEIETNAPYQPFHLDRRIAMSLLNAKLQDTQIIARSQKKSSRPEDVWVFGDIIPTVRVNKSPVHSPNDEEDTGSVMYRETAVDGGHVTSTTKRRKKKVGPSPHSSNQVADEEGIFDDGFEVLGTASDRI